MNLLQFVVAGLELGFGLQAGVLELALGGSVAGLGDLGLVAGGEQGQGGSDKEAVGGLLHGGVAAVADLEFGQPVLPVDLDLLGGGVYGGLCGEDAGVGGHHLGVELIVVYDLRYFRILGGQQFHGDIAVHGPEGLESILPCSLVLGREGADVHPLHFHLIDLYDIGASLGEAFLHQGEELVGIGHPRIQQLFFLIEPDEVEAQELGLQEDVPALEGVLHVEGLVLELAGFAPRDVLRGEVEAHGDYELGAGDSVIAAGEEGAVGYGEVLLEVVLGLDLEPGGLVVLLEGAELKVVPLHCGQHRVDALHALGPEAAAGHGGKAQHCGGQKR